MTGRRIFLPSSHAVGNSCSIPMMLVEYYPVDGNPLNLVSVTFQQRLPMTGQAAVTDQATERGVSQQSAELAAGSVGHHRGSVGGLQLQQPRPGELLVLCAFGSTWHPPEAARPPPPPTLKICACACALQLGILTCVDGGGGFGRLNATGEFGMIIGQRGGESRVSGDYRPVTSLVNGAAFVMSAAADLMR